MVEEEGYEADDIIASYAKVSAKNDFEVKIVSSDKPCVNILLNSSLNCSLNL